MKFIAQRLACSLLVAFCLIGGCNRTDDNESGPVQQPLEAVKVNHQTFLMENKATEDPGFCGISTLKSIYEPSTNSCFSMNVQMAPVQDESGWTGYVWTLELEGRSEKIVFDQTDTSLWINYAGRKIWCYGYQGPLKNEGVENDGRVIFFTTELATLASDLNNSEVLYIATPEPVETCDTFRKKD